jgi:energy-coupling factor transporter ATP-binding protein EcfA2
MKNPNSINQNTPQTVTIGLLTPPTIKENPPQPQPTKGQRQRAAREEFENTGGFEAWKKTFIENELMAGSGIDRSLAELNIKFLEEIGLGFQINLELNQQITRFPEGNLETGEWNRNHNYLAAAFFISETGQIFNAKVAYPRDDYQKSQGFGKEKWVPTGKQRRYEAVTSGGNVIFWPALDKATRERINIQYGCDMPIEGDIWPWLLAHPEIPIGITEGAKKALSLCTQGFLCVAVLGISNWSVPRTEAEKAQGSARVILPELAELAKGDRLIPVWYDQDDTKDHLKAFFNTKKEGQLLTTALKAAGANNKTALMWWPAYMGKGIDDVIVKLLQQSKQSTSNLILIPNLKKPETMHSPSVAAWIEETTAISKNASIYSQNQQLYALADGRLIESITKGSHISDHINLKLEHGKIHAIIAGTGAGKTTVIREQAKAWIKSGGFVVAITPTNNLGKQVAKSIGLPHRHDYNNQDLLQLKAIVDGGFVCCIDSLPKLEKYLPLDMPLLVICEEADQVANHASAGHTLKGKYAFTQESVTRVLTRADAIILAEARIPEITLQYFEQLTNKSTKVFMHEFQINRRQVTCYNGHISGFEALLLQRLKAGERICITSDSRRELEKLERLIRQEIPDIKAMRNDQHTAYLPETEELTTFPNRVLAREQLQCLLYSPSCKSGWDLNGMNDQGELAYKFDRVMAIFRVLPTSDQIQMVARYRPNCPWDIWLAETIAVSGYETYSNPRKLSRQMEEEAKLIAQAWDIPYDPKNRPPLEKIVRDHYVVGTVRAGLEKRINRYSMVQRLIEDGHTVVEQKLEYHKKMADRMKAINDEIDRDWGDLIAGIRLTITDSIDVAIKLEQLETPNPEERAKAEKIRLVTQHPGIDFDHSEICYQATRNYKALIRGVDMEAAARNLNAVVAAQKQATIEQYNESILAVHHLPHKADQVTLMLECGVLELLNSDQAFTSLSPEVLELKRKILAKAPAWERFFSFNFAPEHTPISFLTRAARRLGVAFHVSRPGSEDRPRQYRVYTTKLIEELLAEGMEKLHQAQAKYAGKAEGELDTILEKRERLERKRVQKRRGDFPTGISEPDYLFAEVIKLEAPNPVDLLTAEHRAEVDKLLDLWSQVDTRTNLLAAALARYGAGSSAVSIDDDFDIESTDDDGDFGEMGDRSSPDLVARR